MKYRVRAQMRNYDNQPSWLVERKGFFGWEKVATFYKKEDALYAAEVLLVPPVYFGKKPYR